MDDSVPQLKPERQPAKTTDSTAGNELSSHPTKPDAETTGTNADAAAAPEKPTPLIGDHQNPNGSAATPSVGQVPPAPATAGAEQNKSPGTTNAEKFFTLQQRVPLQVFEHESRGQKLSHWGPTVTSIASILLTMFVWNHTAQLGNKQFELEQKQTECRRNKPRLNSQIFALSS